MNVNLRIDEGDSNQVIIFELPQVNLEIMALDGALLHSLRFEVK